MCTTCGCSPEDIHHDHGDGHHHHDHEHDHDHGTAAVAGGKKITIETDILARNNRLAAANRSMFADRKVFVLNLVSSPGSGKTTLLEKTLKDLSGTTRSAV